MSGNNSLRLTKLFFVRKKKDLQDSPIQTVGKPYHRKLVMTQNRYADKN